MNNMNVQDQIDVSQIKDIQFIQDLKEALLFSDKENEFVLNIFTDYVETEKSDSLKNFSKFILNLTYFKNLQHPAFGTVRIQMDGGATKEMYDLFHHKDVHDSFNALNKCLAQYFVGFELVYVDEKNKVHHYQLKLNRPQFFQHIFCEEL